MGLVYKPLVLICTADLLGEKNTVPWLISWLIMAAEQSQIDLGVMLGLKLCTDLHYIVCSVPRSL